MNDSSRPIHGEDNLKCSLWTAYIPESECEVSSKAGEETGSCLFPASSLSCYHLDRTRVSAAVVKGKNGDLLFWLQKTH